MQLINNFKKTINTVLAIGLLFSIIAPVVPKASAFTTTAAPRVTFTFDDALLSSSTQAAPTLAKYGYKGVLYTTSGCVGSVGTCPAEPTHAYMTWPQVKALNTTYSWEIAAHSVTHPLLASTDPTTQPVALTSDQVIAELTNSKSAILANTGINTTDFATPYGDWTQPVLAQIARYNASHRGFADSIDQGTADGVIDHGNTFPYNDYLLYDLPVQAGVTVDQVKSYIDQTITNKQWLILTFHDIQPVASTSPDDFQYNTADLDAIAAYVKSKNLQVVTINEGLAGGTNLMPNPGFNTAIGSNPADTTTWNTDSAANIKRDTANNGSWDGTVTGPTNSVSLAGTTTNVHLFSPQIAIDGAQPYFIKSYLYATAMTVAAGHEIAYYVDEYDANGVFLQTKYLRSESTVWLENLNLPYTPTSAAVKKVRLQIAVTANSGAKAYLDNVGFYSDVATAITKAGDVNGDGKVDALDLSSILSNWNKVGATKLQGDLNGDTHVDALDLSTVLTNWGK